MTKNHWVLLVVAVQFATAFFFVTDILSALLGVSFRPVSWQIREFIELGAAIGLILGVIAGVYLLRSMERRSERAESQLRAASGAFMELLEDHFSEWGLTPAERDVALFSIKGLSTAGIAEMRQTSEGTVKAQTNAIYRKAGVSGRSQLLSLFIEDLMAEELMLSPKGEDNDVDYSRLGQSADA